MPIRYTLALGMTLLCLVSFPAQSKTLASKQKVDQASELFMSQIKTGEVESAFSIMSAYLGVNMEQFMERGQKAGLDMKQFQSRVGQPLSFAHLSSKSVGEHFYKVTYLLKYEAAALVWELNYYQPEQGWKLVDISFNADINKLFGE